MSYYYPNTQLAYIMYPTTSAAFISAPRTAVFNVPQPEFFYYFPPELYVSLEPPHEVEAQRTIDADEPIQLLQEENDSDPQTDEDDQFDVERYFSDFWFKEKEKHCNTCLQPFYNKQEIHKTELELTCVICMVNKKRMAFPNCGHFVVCFRCGKQCNKCPICSKFGKPINIYLN